MFLLLLLFECYFSAAESENIKTVTVKTEEDWILETVKVTVMTVLYLDALLTNVM